MERRVSAYFISDAHLGAAYLDDKLLTERRLVAFLDSIKNDATHLYLLGDMLDYWFEYRDVVPKGHLRFFGKLAELADKGVHIEWLAGNHDIWLFGYFKEELGIETFDKSRIVELAGRNFFLNHGDTVGWRPRKFRFIQSFFRNRLCQKLFSAVHPRWTVPLALKWSRNNRLEHHTEPKFDAKQNTLVSFSKEYLAEHPEINYFIFGHLHLLGETSINAGGKTAEVVFLGEWISLCTYAHFDGKELKLRRFSYKK